METKHLKPSRPDLKVATPSGGRLPVEGATVPFTTYWARRLAAGDVLEITPEKPSKAAKTSAPKSTQTAPKK